MPSLDDILGKKNADKPVDTSDKETSVDKTVRETRSEAASTSPGMETTESEDKLNAENTGTEGSVPRVQEETPQTPRGETDSESPTKEATEEPTTKTDAEQSVQGGSRLAALGLTPKEEPKFDDVEPSEIVSDESMIDEINEFREHVDLLVKMAETDAPELREGIVSVMKRITTRDHLRDFVNADVNTINKVVSAMRIDYRRRHNAVSERSTKKTEKKVKQSSFESFF